jgi:polar amino acid transport system substrate-binding protein
MESPLVTIFSRLRIASIAAIASLTTCYSGMAAADEFDLSPEQPNRVHAQRNEAAIASIPKGFKFVTSGKFTVAVRATA